MTLSLQARLDPALSTDVRLRAALKALKYSRRRDLPERIDVVLAEAAALEESELLLILTYLDKGPIRISYRLMYEPWCGLSAPLMHATCNLFLRHIDVGRWCMCTRSVHRIRRHSSARIGTGRGDIVTAASP